MTVERLVYTVPEAGKLLSISRASAYEGVRRGQIPSIRVGRRLMVPKAALFAMLARATATRDGDAAANGDTNGAAH